MNARGPRRTLALLCCLALGCAALSAAGGAKALHAAAPLATIADGQIFDAPLQITPGAASASGCTSAQLQRLNAITLQFAFRVSADGLTVAASRSNLTAPAYIIGPGAPGDASVPVAADGSIADMMVTIDHGVLLTIASGQIAVAQTDAAGDASSVAFNNLSGRVQFAAGDALSYCTFSAALTATPDTTPPLAFIPGCSASNADLTPCLILADQEIELDFSEPVDGSALQDLVSAVDGDGNPLTVSAPARGSSGGYAMVSGDWPLGGQVTLTLAGGLPDRAGNLSAESVSQTFAVVADPGDLDAAGNSGFETGDFSGYTLTSNARPPLGSARGSGVAPLTVAADDPASLARIVSTEHGVAPSEGGSMAAIGADQGCAAQEIDLTSSFVVPDGVSALLIDANLLAKHTEGGGVTAPPFVEATVRGAGVLYSDALPTPNDAARLPADGSVLQSGWQQLSVNMSALVGQQVVLTIHVYPATLLTPPPLCLPGTVLLDNLRFS